MQPVDPDPQPSTPSPTLEEPLSGLALARKVAARLRGPHPTVTAARRANALAVLDLARRGTEIGESLGSAR